MKKILMMAFMVLPFIVSAQTQKIQLDTANVFHTFLENGIGEQVPISFKIEYIDNLKNSKVYMEWEKETYANPANAKYVADHKAMQHIELFLQTKLEAVSLQAMQSVKNRMSYSPIKGSSVGRVVGVKVDTMEEISINIPIQAQNGYGNTVMKEWTAFIVWNKAANKEEITGDMY